MTKVKLDPATLRWCARKAESEAQLTYDSRDSVPAELHSRWRELDIAASSLGSLGRFFAAEARRLSRKKALRK